MSEADDVMTRFAAALQASQSGDHPGARAAFAVLWAQVGPGGDPFHRMAIAHSMADVQSDPHEAVAWDLEALEAAHQVTEERLRAAGVPSSVAALFPSLHLNLGESYRRIGDLDAARRHLALGLAAEPSLADDGYGATIRRGLEGLAARLDDT